MTVYVAMTSKSIKKIAPFDLGTDQTLVTKYHKFANVVNDKY